MKTLKYLLACFVILLLAVPAMAADFYVEGNNKYPDDIAAIQQIIDDPNTVDGDTIYLQGTFNFGTNEAAPYIDGSALIYTRIKTAIGMPPTIPQTYYDPNPDFWGEGKVRPGSVFITKDLNIIGQNAVIIGGYRAFTVGMEEPPIKDIGGVYEHHWFYDIDLDGASADLADLGFPIGTIKPVNVSIKGIEFKNSLFNAIWIVASKDSGTTEIAENTFDNAMTLWWGLWFKYEIARAIWVETPSTGYIKPNSIKGTVVISNNKVYGKDAEDANRIRTGYSHALLAWYLDADLEVKDNWIEGIGLIGLAVGALSKKTDIIGNTIINSINDTPGRPCAAMALGEDGYGWIFGTPENEGDAETSRTSIIDNHLINANAWPKGLGIQTVSMNKYVNISNNIIEATVGILVDEVFANAEKNWLQDSTVKANTIKGDGTYGIKVLGKSSGNEFLGNNLTGLDVPFPDESPPGALYYFGEDACNNTVKGYTGGNNSLVIDESDTSGPDEPYNGCNSITGVK